MARPTILAALVLATGLLASSRPAAAQQLQVFPTRIALNNAANNQLAGASFEELPEFSFYATLPYAGVTLHSTDTVNPGLAVFGSATFPTLPSNTLVSLDASAPEPGPVILEFAPAVTAVGLDVSSFYFDGTVSPAGTTLIVTIDGTDGTQSQVLSLTPNGPTFLGLGAVTGSISRVTISNPLGGARLIAVDDLAYGSLSVGIGPLLDQIGQILGSARSSGTIKGLGSSLEDKLREIKRDLARGDFDDVEEGLVGLRNQIRAQRGKKIAPAAADQLTAVIQQALVLVPDEDHRDCHRGGHGGNHGDDRHGH
jgi:hypothetical protein